MVCVARSPRDADVGVALAEEQVEEQESIGKRGLAGKNVPLLSDQERPGRAASGPSPCHRHRPTRSRRCPGRQRGDETSVRG